MHHATRHADRQSDPMPLAARAKTRLHLPDRHSPGPISKWRKPIGSGAVWRRLNFEKIDLSVRRKVIRNRLATDECYRRNRVRTLAEMSKQKRIRVHSDRLIFSFRRTENQLPVTGGPRIRFLKLQKISCFENSRDRMQNSRPRQWRSRSQSGIRISRQITIANKHCQIRAVLQRHILPRLSLPASNQRQRYSAMCRRGFRRTLPLTVLSQMPAGDLHHHR